jgi:hypothetical protein
VVTALPFATANALWLGSGARASLAFRRAYGRRFRFDRVGSVREYQDAVPVTTYEALQEEIEEIKRGRQGVLTEEPVLMFEKTSGSASACKYIPFTRSLRQEFGSAVAAWMADLYGHHPGLLAGGAYWSVSPLAAEREVTEGGLPVGFEEDTEYFGPVERWALSRLVLTPRELPRILNIEAARYVTLRFLVQTERLAFISVWNPSFLSILVDALEEHGERLVGDVREGTLNPPASMPDSLERSLRQQLRPLPTRAALLERLLHRHGILRPRELWPQLRVISAWGDAEAARGLTDLRAGFPHAAIQPKGLLATEGAVSVPLCGHSGAALSVTSHFLEFVDEERPDERPRLAHELEVGGTYTVLISTGGGFYRYALGDRVEVTGSVEATPLVRFLGRAGSFSDLCGEKLGEEVVRRILDAVLAASGIETGFAMLAPEWGQPPAYVLLLQARSASPWRLEKLETEMEAGLMASHHYAYCRRLGQLGPVRAIAVGEGAAEAYLERCAALGQRRGNVKPAALRRETGWAEWFQQTCGLNEVPVARG